MARDDLTSALNNASMLQTIGALVVNASHVEGAMCRVICWVDGERPHSVTERVARMKIPELLERTAQQAETSPDAKCVSELLDEHKAADLFTLRNNVVHGRVMLDGSNSFTAVRNFPRRGPAIILGERSELDDASRHFGELRNAIYEVMPPSPIKFLGSSGD
jgi:hypothetical protein